MAIHSILAGLLALLMWIILGTIGRREESLENFLSVRGILELVRQLACRVFFFRFLFWIVAARCESVFLLICSGARLAIVSLFFSPLLLLSFFLVF